MDTKGGAERGMSRAGMDIALAGAANNGLSQTLH